MARPKDLLKVEGTLGELTYYDSIFGRIARRKGGPSKKMIKTSAKMVRVREQCSEFGEAVKAAKLFRLGLGLKSRGIREHSATWRTNQLMNSVKRNDTSSIRGKRNAEDGFANSVGKALLSNFNITEKAVLKEILVKPVIVNSGSRTIAINNLVPANDIKFPKGASHVKITGGYSRIDFSKEEYELVEASEVILPLKSKTVNNVLLKMKAATIGKAYDFYFLHLEFLQQTNLVYYDLADNKYNCMSVLQVV